MTQQKSAAEVLKFPASMRRQRRKGLNRNKQGSLFEANSRIHYDFYYMGERVRIATGIRWNEENRKKSRKNLDTIQMKIIDGSFRFAKMFPAHKKASYFADKENKLFGIVEVITPEQVSIVPYVNRWFELLKESGRVRQRTLLGYKSYIENYYDSFFADMVLGDLNKVSFEKFIGWLRKQKLRDKVVSNKTINKVFVPLKMVCKDASAEYGWGRNFDPFYGFKRLKEQDAYKRINPFSFDEQMRLVSKIDVHYRPFVRFAFATGLRTGEQIAIKPKNIDWKNKILRVETAMTLDLEGKNVEGETKNEYSQRTLHLLDFMFEILLEQKKVFDGFKKKPKYLFCTPAGTPIHRSNFRRRVWIPAIEASEMQYRELYQTRHTFATLALASGETPLWIADFMGHRNTEMVIKVYSKHVKKLNLNDGRSLAERYRKTKSSEDEA
ncbi:tyrosine-type recombinase/integrase [Thermodesulfobacteriota bacterium]